MSSDIILYFFPENSFLFQSVSWCRLTLFFIFSQRILYFFPKCKLMSSNSAAFPTSGWSSRVEAAAGHKVFFAFCTFPFGFKTHTGNQTPMKCFFRTLGLGWGWGSKVLNLSVKKTHDILWHINCAWKMSTNSILTSGILYPWVGWVRCFGTKS